MRLRLPLLVLVALVVGCVSGDLASAWDERPTSSGPTLVLESPAESSVLPNASLELSVRYRDPQGAPAPGVQIEFALTGVSPGASLTPWRVVTDGAGVATTRLRVGSMPGKLEVRATSDDASAVYARVSVREVLDTQLSVRVAYDGKREVTSYTAAALSGVRCEKALRADVPESAVRSLPASTRSGAFQVSPDTETAILAWGHDARGALLARGCVDYRASSAAAVSGARQELVVMLADTPLALASALPVELQLSVLPTAHRLAEAVEQAVSRAVPGAQEGAAALYLDHIARVAGVAPSLLSGQASALAELLASEGVGPVPLAEQLSLVLTRRAPGIALTASYEPSTGLVVEGARTLPVESGAALALPVAPAVALSGRFDAETSRLLVDRLEVTLSRGAYALAVLAAASTEDEAALARAAGCREVVGPWVARTGTCSLACGVGACEDAVAAVRRSIDASLAELSSAPISLDGSVSALDRSQDGAVDDLVGSALRGSWADDTVEGDLRTSRPAL